MSEKKVLILTYSFPPLPSIASMRVYGWLKHAPKNYQITVITRNWIQDSKGKYKYYKRQRGEITRTENLGNHEVRRVAMSINWFEKLVYFARNENLKLLSKLFTFCEYIFKWLPLINVEHAYLLSASKNALDREKFDLIIATGGPFVLLKYASVLSSKYNIPWIADFRDPWNLKGHINRAIIVQRYECFWERQYLKNVSIVTGATPVIEHELNQLGISKKFYQLDNGVDVEFYESINENPPIDKSYFNIVFTGSLYQSHRLDFFLNSFLRFIKEATKARVYFVGVNLKTNPYKQELEKLKCRIPDHIEVIDHVSHASSIAYQKGADLLLKFNAFDQSKGNFGGKLYEYFLSGKYVLSISNPNHGNRSIFPVSQIFQYFAFNEDDILRILSQSYELWENGELEERKIEMKDRQAVSKKEQSKRLFNLIAREL